MGEVDPEKALEQQRELEERAYLAEMGALAEQAARLAAVREKQPPAPRSMVRTEDLERLFRLLQDISERLERLAEVEDRPGFWAQVWAVLNRRVW